MEHVIDSPRRDSIANQMNAMEKYEQLYGIQRADDPSPVALSLIQPSTDFIRGGYYERTVSELLKLRIPESTHTPLDQLLELPRHRLQSLIEVTKRLNFERNRKEDAAGRAAAKEGEKNAGKLK